MSRAALRVRPLTRGQGAGGRTREEGRGGRHGHAYLCLDHGIDALSHFIESIGQMTLGVEPRVDSPKPAHATLFSLRRLLARTCATKAAGAGGSYLIPKRGRNRLAASMRSAAAYPSSL